ncbi:MAG: 50S ribosomal protein L36 [Chloroflexi bacterium]|nr:50S ribosomal protein L36 [Chloroflexota bacterium]
MKISASVRKRCIKCKIITRPGVVKLICDNRRHNQKQG